MPEWNTQTERVLGYIYVVLSCYIYILSVFTEKPYSKAVERNEVYVSSQATSHAGKWRQNKPWSSTIWLDVGDVMTSMALFRCSL